MVNKDIYIMTLLSTFYRAAQCIRFLTTILRLTALTFVLYTSSSQKIAKIN